MAVLVADHVRDRAGDPAVIDDRGTTTWEDLDRRVNRLVNALRHRGLGEGDVVALMAGNQVESIEVALACLHGGWLLVPVNWHWVAAELAHVLLDADAAALVVGADWIEVARAAEGPDAMVRVAMGQVVPPGFVGYEELVATASDQEPVDQVRGGVMFYTSGTTGHPKGVRGGLAQVGGPPEILQFVAAALVEIMEPAPHRPVQLVCGPMYHSAQWVFAMIPLLVGATVVLQHRFDPEAVLSAVDEHQVTNVHLVPAQFSRLLKVAEPVRAAFSGASLHRVLHGAAPCPPGVKAQMIDWWGPVVSEYYGGTEGGFITLLTADQWRERPTSVGRVLPNIEVLVVGPDGQRLGPGETGDLYFRNLLGVDFEYHNAADKTAAAHLEPGVGTLGDVGYLDEDGFLFLSDRRIDMIISGGVNIYPAEIEAALAAHPAVLDSAVFGIPHDEMGEQVMAVVAVVPERRSDPNLTVELEAYLREGLAGYKCPRRWEIVDDLPRSEAGKLVKRMLRDPWWEGTGRSI